MAGMRETLYDMNAAKYSQIRHISIQARRRYVHAAAILASMTVLQAVGLVHQSWYSIHVDLDTCVNCSPIIRAVAEILENDVIEDSTLQKRLNLPVSQNELRELTDGLDVGAGGVADVEEYAVRDRLAVHVGLWGVAICSGGLPMCVRLGITQATSHLAHIQPYTDILEGVRQGRPFLLLATLVSVCTTISAAAGWRTSGDGSMVKALSAGLSGVLCLLTVVTVGMPYLTVRPRFPGPLPAIPWALMATGAAGYLGLYAGYTLRTHSTSSRTTYPYTWTYRRSHKYT